MCIVSNRTYTVCWLLVATICRRWKYSFTKYDCEIGLGTALMTDPLQPLRRAVILPQYCCIKTAVLSHVFTGRMPRSGKLPVLFLLTGQKSSFSPRRGDSLHRFRSIFAGPTGTWVRLALQNLTSIAPRGWECGPQNIKNFHFLVKSRPAGATPLTDFDNF